jgi:hypothetical protein
MTATEQEKDNRSVLVILNLALTTDNNLSSTSKASSPRQKDEKLATEALEKAMSSINTNMAAMNALSALRNDQHAT